jgi:hypothetical protein
VTAADYTTEAEPAGLGFPYTAPYFTVFEVTSDAGSNWHEIARVEDGEGGGYRNGQESDRHCIGGAGGGSKFLSDDTVHQGYEITNASGMQNSGVATLREEALTFVPATPTMPVDHQQTGVFFAPGDDGNDAISVIYPSDELKGISGRGGTIYDAFPTAWRASTMNAIEEHERGIMHVNVVYRRGNAMDQNAPGGGASGCEGATKLDESKLAWGGHALAGSAWATYSDTAYDTY